MLAKRRHKTAVLQALRWLLYRQRVGFVQRPVQTGGLDTVEENGCEAHAER